MRSTLFLITALCCATPAAAQTCTFTPQPDSTNPALNGQMDGRVAYEDNAAGGNLYIFDFKTHAQTTLPLAGWGLSQGLNPVFSPNGKYLMFRAVTAGDESHIFMWQIGSLNGPVNLTGAWGNLRNEDPKFSADGTVVVWKRSRGIATAGLSYDSSGVPSLSNPVQLLTGDPGPTEKSGPSFAPSGKYIYYWLGTGSTAQIYRINRYTGVIGPLPRNGGGAYYYPATLDYYDFLYVRQMQPAPPGNYDQIWFYSALTRTSTVLNPGDCAANNSDPTPVDEDYFLYARSTDGVPYKLYVSLTGATNYAWSLGSLNLPSATGAMLGADYTPMPSQ